MRLSLFATWTTRAAPVTESQQKEVAIKKLTGLCKNYLAHLDREVVKQTTEMFLRQLKTELTELDKLYKAKEITHRDYQFRQQKLREMVDDIKGSNLTKAQRERRGKEHSEERFNHLCEVCWGIVRYGAIPRDDVSLADFKNNTRKEIYDRIPAIQNKSILLVNLLDTLDIPGTNSDMKLHRFRELFYTNKTALTERRYDHAGGKFWQAIDAILTKLGFKKTTAGITSVGLSKAIDGYFKAVDKKLTTAHKNGNGHKRLGK